MDTISSWPQDERPREKLLKYGAENLSNAELLAIFLRTGIKGKNAVELARSLLHKFGGLRKLLAADSEELRSIKGLGPSKITQLKAVLELASRYLEEKTRGKKWFDSSENVHRYLSYSMRDLKHEVVKVIFLNAQNEIIEIDVIGKGGITKNTIDPKDILARAIKYNAVGLIFVHNHPSGNPAPSRKDKKMTARFVIICKLMELRLLDHIIIGRNGFYSFANEGLI